MSSSSSFSSSSFTNLDLLLLRSGFGIRASAASSGQHVNAADEQVIRQFPTNHNLFTSQGTSVDARFPVSDMHTSARLSIASQPNAIESFVPQNFGQSSVPVSAMSELGVPTLHTAQRQFDVQRQHHAILSLFGLGLQDRIGQTQFHGHQTAHAGSGFSSPASFSSTEDPSPRTMLRLPQRSTSDGGLHTSSPDAPLSLTGLGGLGLANIWNSQRVVLDTSMPLPASPAGSVATSSAYPSPVTFSSGDSTPMTHAAAQLPTTFAKMSPSPPNLSDSIDNQPFAFSATGVPSSATHSSMSNATLVRDDAADSISHLPNSLLQWPNAPNSLSRSRESTYAFSNYYSSRMPSAPCASATSFIQPTVSLESISSSISRSESVESHLNISSATSSAFPSDQLLLAPQKRNKLDSPDSSSSVQSSPTWFLSSLQGSSSSNHMQSPSPASSTREIYPYVMIAPSTPLPLNRNTQRSSSAPAPASEPFKHARSAYVFFVADQRRRLAKSEVLSNSSFRQVATAIGHQWRSMSPEEKRVCVCLFQM
jgi:hypothetical protein